MLFAADNYSISGVFGLRQCASLIALQQKINHINLWNLIRLSNLPAFDLAGSDQSISVMAADTQHSLKCMYVNYIWVLPKQVLIGISFAINTNPPFDQNDLLSLLVKQLLSFRAISCAAFVAPRILVSSGHTLCMVSLRGTLIHMDILAHFLSNPYNSLSWL